ncbi:Rab GTPase [Tieghemostelium lacteum]|uniref:Rab GTPase n=1 Tax=Tieghemostelium lacteum TaxID=361077 RepID=A0A152A523_TIELA|nr:Rab GTPase [Tieghemostelium lacteum]|eukprot:KYR01342.1 Rab GTPase [Tieghemostelium lacteum]
MMEDPHLIKLLIVGDMGVVGVDLGVQDFKIGNFHLRVQFWDIAGQERYMQSIPSIYFRNTDASLVFSDVSRPNTITNAINWCNLIDQQCNSIPKLLIVNKYDLVISKHSEVPEDTIREALGRDGRFKDVFYCSNYHNIGIKESISYILNIVVQGKISKLNVQLPIPSPPQPSFLFKLFRNSNSSSNENSTKSINSNNSEISVHDRKEIKNLNYIVNSDLAKNLSMNTQISGNLISINEAIQKELIQQSEIRKSFKITYIDDEQPKSTNTCFSAIGNFFKNVIVGDEDAEIICN